MATHIISRTANLHHLLNKTETDITIDSLSSLSTQSSYSAYNNVDKSGAQPPLSPDTRQRFEKTTIRWTDSSPTIRKLRLSETKQAALCLAEAFIDDDMAQYFTHTPDRAHCSDKDHWRLQIFIMEEIVRAHIVCGLATVIGDNYDCVALWMPPGKTMDGIKSRMRKVLRKRDFEGRLSQEGMVRFFDEFFPVLHDAKHDVLGDKGDANSWYLVYIGTKFDSRKRGYARKLIQHTLNKADKQKVPAYLESSNEANTKLYNRLGFEHVRDVTFVRAEEPVILDIMVRQPVGTSKDSKTGRIRKGTK